MEKPNIVLNVNGIEVIYNHVILVLKGVSLQVPEGKIVAILGGNGAGKTTTLRAISNLLRGERGDVTKGSIELRGERIENLSPADLVQRGVVQVMEGRHCFAHLTIEENLLTGGYTRKNKAEVTANLEKVYNYFPRLKTRRTSQAAYTSGGEQQMCAIGRALMANPSMVLLDEPSMGLAPQIVEEVFEIVKDLNQKEKVTFLLAEQNTNMALRYADYGYIMESGRVVMDGVASDLANNEDVKEYRLRITVELTLLDPVENKVVWKESAFGGESTYYTTGPLAKSESAAIDEINFMCFPLEPGTLIIGCLAVPMLRLRKQMSHQPKTGHAGHHAGHFLSPAFIIRPDGPPRMVKRPTGSGGEPSSPNCGASAGVRLVNLIIATYHHEAVPSPCLVSQRDPRCCPGAPSPKCSSVRIGLEWLGYQRK